MGSNGAGSIPLGRGVSVKITSDLFDAYLKCPTKCWLRASSEPSTGTDYQKWVTVQNASYRTAETERLIAARSGATKSSPSLPDIQTVKWTVATNFAVEAQSNSYTLQSTLHAVEHVSPKDNARLLQFIPIRFVFRNKLINDDKLLLGFDAFVLSNALGCEIYTGKIIHGHSHATCRVTASPLYGEVRKHITAIGALLSGPTPPELILNRHCIECEFRDRCRKIAQETDDLSLLSGTKEKERSRLHNKGIFTVTQLSYTFRPKRPRRRAKRHQKTHDLALQALAIRNNTVYIHGMPDFPECKTRVYLDIEGVPDRSLCYLLGALIVTEENQTFLSFWADMESEETTIVMKFVEAIRSLSDYRIFHYGRYDAAAIKRVAATLPEAIQREIEVILQRSVDVLSLIRSHIYFPTYTNALKDVARYLCGDSIRREATGLDSIIWRAQWEDTQDPNLKLRLLEYNKTDCIALMHVTEFIARQSSPIGADRSEDGIAVNRTEEMTKTRPHWQLFAAKQFALDDLRHVNKSAYFDYQREKVFIRTYPQFKSINKRAPKDKAPTRPNRKILVEAQSCPHCRSRKLKRSTESSHDVVDLAFYKNGVRKCTTRYVSWRYSCTKCGNTFRSEIRLPHPQKYGHGLVSWCAYQNNVAGVNMSKIRKGLAEIFDLNLSMYAVESAKDRIANLYKTLYEDILSEIGKSKVINIDETTVRRRGVYGYVWILTTMDKVYYCYRPSRETDFLREILASFRGVLVSDFYAGYDAIPCEQQKCLVHLVRDIDDDLLRNPLDQELKRLAEAFGRLLRAIITTVDRFGLKRRHLNKHKKAVERFLTHDAVAPFTSEVANKYKKRFDKYGLRMFTFIAHDGVPWNNNNAEHAIKRFVKYRRENDGRYTEKTVKTYLILASVFETCEFNNVNTLKYLLSRSQSLETLVRMGGRKRKSRMVAYSVAEDTLHDRAPQQR